MNSNGQTLFSFNDAAQLMDLIEGESTIIDNCSK